MGTLFKSMYENAHCELLSDETLNLKTKETLIRVNKKFNPRTKRRVY